MDVARKLRAFAVSASIPNCYRESHCKSEDLRDAALMCGDLEMWRISAGGEALLDLCSWGQDPTWGARETRPEINQVDHFALHFFSSQLW